MPPMHMCRGIDPPGIAKLAYCLYTVCEQKKCVAEALAYNGLVQSWPDIVRLAREGSEPSAEQGGGCSGEPGAGLPWAFS